MQTLRDRLSRLSYQKAISILGKSGRRFLVKGNKYEINLNNDVEIAKNLCRIKVDDTLVSIIDDER